MVLHYREQRKAVRLRPDGGLRVRVAPGGSGEPRILRATDISRTGALLESDRPFEIGEEIDMGFPEPPAAPGRTVPARVERSWKVEPGDRGRAFRVGVRFLEGRPGGTEALEALLEALIRRGIEPEGDS